eukprot:TRINITY_DN68810_c0_g1_i1.p1 TRINITY_DN68810_c0_g1~~TRINITY_DN68810_c0_g1_i1.p1  ORF type:complete len:491 (-),score=125.63 TRINITY_DN68810_c0_g1_i1:333-1727(-)
MASTMPTFMYFPAAGRGELSRLISAAGEVPMNDYFPGMTYKKYVGFFGSMPAVKHGNFSMCQTAAIEKYLAALSPKFKNLTAQQVALDNMFAASLEDMRAACYKVVFGNEEAKSKAKDTIPPALDKYLSGFEELVPEESFVHGLDFPTTADLALVNFAEAAGPFCEAMALAGGYDWAAKYPKIKANVDRTKAAPGVKEYLATTGTMKQEITAGFKAKVVAKTLGHALTFGLFRSVKLDTAAEGAPAAGPARPAVESNSNSKPELVYFPVAGRGELARLICAAGGLELTDTPAQRGEKAGFFGQLPVLKHGDFSICQSGAIESYLAAIAPKFQSLTTQQRAVDDMFAATKEDMLVGCAKVVFGDEETKKAAPETIPKHLDKFLSVLETLVPAEGFIQGLDFPTVADLSLLNFAEGGMPFAKAIELAGGYDWQSKYPRIKANVDRTKEAPGVKEYVASSSSLGGLL